MSILQYPPDQLIQVSCPNCDSSASTEIGREFGLGVRRCAECSLIYASPRLLTPQQHYHQDRENILKKYGGVLRGERGTNRDPNYLEELAVLSQLKPSGKLLDIGSHCGFFLRMARGMSWELYGVEPSPAAEFAREYFGLNVVQGSLEEVAFPAESFDVITMIDLIEHIEAPQAMLTEVHRILKPDGLVFIKTPNAIYNLFKYRLIRQTLRMEQVEIFDAKEHVVQYTREMLGTVLERAGLEIFYDFVPHPIQDGAAWKCGLRWTASTLARVQHRLAGGTFGPLATDLAVVARKGAAA